MNYYAAREVKAEGDKPGGWYYSVRNDGQTWRVGDCTEHEPHATKDEAYLCWTNYLLANKTRLDGIDARTKRPCVVKGCDEWTQGYAEVDMRIFYLCDEHRTAEVVRQLFGIAGDAMSSW